MSYKLHMNGVITGSLNSFCLACDAFLTNHREANQHVDTPEHQVKRDAVPYSDKFHDEHIKKFKAGYYCEFCNVLLPIAAKVSIHVTEEEHKHNKGTLLLKPLGADVVAFNNILIEEAAWHGLIEGVCSLCNAEFDEEYEHKTDSRHYLNLVLKPVQFRADNAIYRNLDETSTQCLTCNKLLSPCNMEDHFKGPEHLELYSNRRNATNGACNDAETKTDLAHKESNETSVLKTDNVAISSEVDSKINTDNKSRILDCIHTYQAEGININFETETAYCKQCCEVIEFYFIDLETHIESHSSPPIYSDLQYPVNPDPTLNKVNLNDKTTESSEDMKNKNHVNNALTWKTNSDECKNDESGTDDKPLVEFEDAVDNAKDFAIANKITYNENNNKSYCRICKVHLPASLKSMKEHVTGAPHKKMEVLATPSTTKSAAVRASISDGTTKAPNGKYKQVAKQFLKSAYDVECFFYHCTIINEEYCILRDSFHLISNSGSRLRCIVCEVNIPSVPFLDLIDHHANCKQHNLNLMKVPFITSEKDEIIREVRPGLYHCGYCNLCVSGWSVMQQHLKCNEHRENRTQWESRLMNYLPSLQRHRLQEFFERLAESF